MRINFQGGASEVGASCVLVNIDDKNLLFDCGMRMKGSDTLPDMSTIQQKGGVDAIFVSHAHMDHSGSLPIISREYPQAPIYMTHATKDIIRVLLYDSLKIMENKEAEIPVFAEVHVINMLKRIVCYSPDYTFKPFNDDIKVTFYNAGHVAGSSGIYVASKEGAFFYSGDFSISSQQTVQGARIPRLRPDVAVVESTYGDRLHANRKIEERKLIDKVKEVILANGKILIPAFALGRAQEVILILQKAINKGKLPKFKIYVDGMVKNICRVYQLNPNYLKNQLAKKIFKGNDIFYNDNVIAVTGRKKQREEIVSKNEPCCIISSSGMLSGGPSQWYAKKLSSNESNFIALTGYQDEESPGRKLLELLEKDDSDKYLKLGEENLPVKCGMEKYGLSAHADKTQIVALAHLLSPRHLFFVHGNSETVSNLASEVQKEYKGNVYSPINGDEYEFKLNKPRKQRIKQNTPTLNKQSKPCVENIELIWDFILKTIGKDKANTAEDIFYIFSGTKDFNEEDILKMQEYLNESTLFEPDNRKPFMFRPIDRQTALLQSQKEKYMEVNQMLALVDEYFPKDSGLYKKGARFDKKIAVLNFNFPDSALEKYKDQIKKFEEATQWRVEINEECNTMEVENLISRLLPNCVEMIGSASYFRIDKLFKVKISTEFKEEDVVNKFKKITGMDIVFEVKGKEKNDSAKPVKRQKGQMEQNMALNIITEAFNEKEDKLYKKSLKQGKEGPYIELLFISPNVGKRYINLINELEARTWWNIKINQTPNQHEIIKLGSQIFAEMNVLLKRNLSYLPKQKKVKALTGELDEQLKKKIQAKFLKVTGLEIILE